MNTILWILSGLIIFTLGELICNSTLFPYLARYFAQKESAEGKNLPTDGQPENSRQLFGLSLSVAKGVLERGVLFVALIADISSILVVFGALKLGTRLDTSKNKISNDYFLFGNLSSILVVLIYRSLFNFIQAI